MGIAIVIGIVVVLFIFWKLINSNAPICTSCGTKMKGLQKLLEGGTIYVCYNCDSKIFLND
jgi:predicted RNA-binding Zn-ribbon protein involved in translation (DUF1610 family)